uniref:Uncharacterized protein n=1 Tax=Oryza glumipatula TaxID=40148 RepID=A0A0D9ZIH2_9ORYZ
MSVLKRQMTVTIAYVWPVGGTTEAQARGLALHRHMHRCSVCSAQPPPSLLLSCPPDQAGSLLRVLRTAASIITVVMPSGPSPAGIANKCRQESWQQTKGRTAQLWSYLRFGF